jgi:hypothetical protein
MGERNFERNLQNLEPIFFPPKKWGIPQRWHFSSGNNDVS